MARTRNTSTSTIPDAETVVTDPEIGENVTLLHDGDQSQEPAPEGSADEWADVQTMTVTAIPREVPEALLNVARKALNEDQIVPVLPHWDEKKVKDLVRYLRAAGAHLDAKFTVKRMTYKGQPVVTVRRTRERKARTEIPPVAPIMTDGTSE